MVPTAICLWSGNRLSQAASPMNSQSRLPSARKTATPDRARIGAGEGNSMAEQSKEPSKGADNTDSASLKSLFSDVIWMASAFWVSRQRNKLLALAGGLIVVVGATAYMQIRLNSWNRPFYNALTNKDMPGFLAAALGLRRDRGHIACPQRGADVAQSELQGRLAPRPGERSPGPVAQAEARVPPVEFGPARRQPRPAPPSRRSASDRSFHRLRHRPSAVEPSSAHLRRRPLGALEGPVSADRWPRLRAARLSRLVRAGLRRGCFVRELARRPPADQSQCRALCERGGFSFRARADKRAHRRHYPLRRRGRREGPPQWRVRRRARHFTADRQLP